MKDLNVKDKTITIRLNSELHRLIKMKSAQLEKTITDYILDLVKKDL